METFKHCDLRAKVSSYLLGQYLRCVRKWWVLLVEDFVLLYKASHRFKGNRKSLRGVNHMSRNLMHRYIIGIWLVVWWTTLKRMLVMSKLERILIPVLGLEQGRAMTRLPCHKSHRLSLSVQHGSRRDRSIEMELLILAGSRILTVLRTVVSRSKGLHYSFGDSMKCKSWSYATRIWHRYCATCSGTSFVL